MNSPDPPVGGRRDPLAIVVVDYGSHALLRRHLTGVEDDLRAHGRDPLVVVVGNLKDADSRAAVGELCRERGWTCVEEPGNVGFGRGVDDGVAAARREGATRFLILNPDASIDAASVSALEAVVAADPMTLVGPVIRTPSGAIWSDGNDLRLSDGRTKATRKRSADDGEVVEWLSGACLLVDHVLWDAVGGFGDDYFLYWEDVDLSWRVQEVGGAVCVVREATALHDEGGTHDDAVGAGLSNTFYYFNVRNRLLFAALRLDSAAQRRWVLTAPAAAKWILLWGGRRQFLDGPAPLLAAARGTRDGLRMMREARSGARPAVWDGAFRPVRVLASFPEPRPTTNPYIVMLRQSLDARDDVELSTFTWRRALTGSYDVFHAHWPEILVAGASPLKALVRQGLFAVVLARFAARGTAIVRTVHNLELPQGISRRERILLRLFDARTAHRIRINTSTDLTGTRGAWSTVLHGHYGDWFTPQAVEPVPGRIAFVGLIRRYKAVDALVRAFVATRDEPGGDVLSLVVAGKPSSEDLAQELRALCAGDERARLELAYLPDDDLARTVREASLVVLPAPEMHNSGTVLMALSLDRPVLVPDNAVNRTLADEVGPGWVHTFTGTLSPSDLTRALAVPPSGRPDLSARGWAQAGAAHADVYRRAATRRTATHKTVTTTGVRESSSPPQTGEPARSPQHEQQRQPMDTRSARGVRA